MRPKEIKKLIDLLEASTINELEVSRFGRKVKIRKNSGAHSERVALPSSSTTTIEKPAVSPSSPPDVVTQAVIVPQNESNLIEVRSPMVGTFYRAPSPEADPYVQQGDIIAPNQVLCIIEAMKLMNEIESEIRGRVVEILGENGKPVEYNQLLFRIEKI
ncbi:MAG TPA: acetyl-CoA carboxylase biotin carboxyl carrier protein [bacterium]|nr:acetyl-CoA carboxylase biotin carboxyl carrier protein [bacterium]